MSELLVLSFESEPGTYELVTEGEQTYEVRVPETYIDPGTLKLSLFDDEVDPDHTDSLVLVGMEIMVGQPAFFNILRSEGVKTVRGPVVTEVKQVG